MEDAPGGGRCGARLLAASPRVYIPSVNRASPAAGSGVRTRGFRRPRARAGGEDEPEPTEYEVEGAEPALSPGMALFVFGVDRTTLYEAFDRWDRVLYVAKDR